MVSYTDFKGVTTDGTVVPDLFAVHSTGVSTAAVVAAGTAFVAALTDAQKAETLYDVTADQWLNWSNIHNFSRNGVRMKDMTAAQQKAALAVLQAGLSAEGLALSNNIRKLNHVTGRLMGRLDQFDEDLYFITVMGTPSQTEPWGWQFQGHHLVLNYFVLGDQVVMTPTFLGSEPRVGYYDDGTKIELFTEELAAGVAMINALDASQKAEAITAATKGGTVNSTEAGKDNAVLPYAGIKVSELTTAQQTRLLDLANLFVGNMDTGHAAVKMAEIKDKLAETYFAWQGPTTADGAFYFRIQSPVILIEFDCQGGGPASGAVEAALVPDNATKTGVVSGNTQGGGPAPGGSGGPQPGSGPPGADASGGAAPGGGGGGGSRNHIHAVIRTPNGNDYGFDLLKEHLATHPHPSAT
ncbi:hypothetical protein Pve01_69290 [Planomonospora venezuelensis]|nr:hypothetical protein Pve01_69290 [Planomonospora venezuelensis]